MTRLLVLITLIAVAGCTATPQAYQAADREALFNDALFPDYQSRNIESMEQVFALNKDAKEFVDEAVGVGRSNEDKIKLLSRAVFNRAYLGLKYSNEATATASETFNTGVANCLSMTIMTYSMANYAGLQTQFYTVDVPEYWTRRQGVSLLNGHVNLELKTGESTLGSNVKQRAVIIDFDPQEMRNLFRTHKMSKQQILALFYNNRAADALIASDFVLAYHYLNAAAEYAPMLDDIWINLGVLYRMKGEYDLAEKAYHYAADLRPQSYTVYENLAILYRAMGQLKKAEKLDARVAIARRDNPFYHFILAEEARGSGDYERALSLYRKAIRLDNARHEFHYGMGSAYYELGDITQAVKFLERAARHATLEEDKTRYRGKLSALQSGVR
ncbi:tetratricopeptide repeat protein [Alteromonas sediminis]|uniref:Tetratricopeptide repeat protein n=1 Tax=Alteromonas sediminis TaxID=2259342 RepID=A0A3N5YM29_9ALTE|nr:tetratricopeptide repeat protein [Alteromonas sediminis]RPJ66301.1 tetratricopeptide repeat protein [Alteromonas sediminis]